MCTPLCPCDGASVNQSQYINGYGRDESLVIIGGPNGKYTTFRDCYEDLLTDRRIETHVQDPILKLVKYLENKYQCTGLCNTPVFSFY